MEIALITEGTYPYHLGGVSVWCDQLVSELSEHSFGLLAVCATGTEKASWELPSNVSKVESVPLWAHLPARRAGKSLRRRFAPVAERFLQSLEITSGGAGFVSSLRELGDFALAGELTSAMVSREVIDLLLELAPTCTDRPVGEATRPLTVADATDALVLLEHFLRPLAVPAPRTDLCHSTANGLGTLPALAAKWAWGTPFLLTEHGVYLRELYLAYKPGKLSQGTRSIVLRFFKLLIEAAYDHADIVAPVCKYNRLWETANGTKSARIRPIQNGIDPSAFPVVAEPTEPTLVWVGRIDPLKDLETLLRAFAEVKATLPQCRLKIYGPVPAGGEEYYQRCVDLARELHIAGSATFEGRVSPSATAFQSGQVVVLTSISEGLPYVVLEAMASGRPVVATDVGGVAEAIGGTGALVPPRDPSAVAQACIRLLVHDKQRRALGAAARGRVLHLFTTRRVFRTYRKLYEELVSSQETVIELREPSIVELRIDAADERALEAGVLI